MSDKGKVLYEELKDKLKELEDEDSPYFKFTDIWQLGCQAKYKSYDLRFLYEDTSREFVDRHREHVEEMKEDFLENLEEYVEKCMTRMQKTNHFKVHYAKTNEEAQKIFMEELGDNKVIYKSKSLEAKDTGIYDALKENNITVKETDLGDVMCQMLDYDLPTYSLGPGVQFTPEEIVAKIKEKYGAEVEPTPDAIVGYFRKTYRPELLNDVKVSLTSANAIAADDGTILLVENEGNISIITRATEKHIVVVGIQKIVPTVFDALLCAKIQERIMNVDGAYISLISAPSNTSDVQGARVFGMYGAKEVVVILVDEWRTKAVKENLFYKDLLKCISCKSCHLLCTAFRAFGNIYASKYGLGGEAIVRDYIHNGIEAAVKDGLFLCTGCENCSNWCPAGIDLAEMMRELKREATEKGLCPPNLETYKDKILKDKNPFK
ncbi:MAG: lactate utilization protein [Promethearchaeota archaeon]|nr:MAG: lactate utilization protein [Candidatus Lokiarchaeota archaeon]